MLPVRLPDSSLPTAPVFCKREYHGRALRFTDERRSAIIRPMAAPKKNKPDFVLQELIAAAGRMNIEVRTEKLLREVGYHARSGGCSLKGQRIIIMDRDAPLRDQIEFLTEELAAQAAAAESATMETKPTDQGEV